MKCYVLPNGELTPRDLHRIRGNEVVRFRFCGYRDYLYVKRVTVGEYAVIRPHRTTDEIECYLVTVHPGYPRPVSRYQADPTRFYAWFPDQFMEAIL